MANSRQIVPGNLTIFCDSYGEWNTSRLESRCICKEGMVNRDGFCTGTGIYFDRPIFFVLMSSLETLRYFVCMIVYIYYYYVIEK